MNMQDMLKQSGALDSIAQELGIDRQSAQSGASALLPALLGGFRKQAQMDASGGGSLLGLVNLLGGGNLLDAVTSRQPTVKQPGNQILGHVFGSKDVSRTVASQAAQSTGIDSSVLKKMLPLLAMAVSGYLANRSGAAQQGGGAASETGGGGLFGQMLGAGTQSQPGQPGQASQASQAGQQGESSGLLGMLDTDGDGNPLDDVLRMAGKFRR